MTAKVIQLQLPARPTVPSFDELLKHETPERRELALLAVIKELLKLLRAERKQRSATIVKLCTTPRLDPS
jgi:hypothetical protein